MKALVRKHRDDGIDMDAWTPTPLWRGERLDLGYAVNALIRLDEQACVRDTRRNVSAETSAGEGGG